MNRKWLSWDRENYIFPKVTKMGSIFGHRIDHNGVGVLKSQRHMTSKKLIQVTAPPEIGIINQMNLTAVTSQPL